MKISLRLLIAAMLAPIILTVSASAAPIARSVDYQVGDVTCEGWSVLPNESSTLRPGILIVHQWTGLSDYEKMRAGMLAEMGYNVFALDIYGKGIRPQPPESGKYAGKYKSDRALYRQRLSAGLDMLRAMPGTDPDRIAAIGYCFGGTGVLELARSGAKIAGVVSFHGGLSTPTPEDAKNITCRVLVLHGADDPSVPPAEVAAFRKEMEEAGVKYELIAYPGAVHAFTQRGAGDDVSKGAAYNAEADVKSWEAMTQFFSELFGK